MSAGVIFNIVVTPRPAPILIQGIHESAEGIVALSWTTEAGGVYRVLMKHQLTDATWITLQEVTATGSSTSITNSMGDLPQGFFAVQRVR